MTATRQCPARDYLRNIWNALYSTWEGMSVTLSHMYRRPITTQYPDRIAKPVEDRLPERYRGILEAEVDLCTGCQACARDCPIGCIDAEVRADPGSRQRLIHRFSIDIGKCMYCGLCTDACPSGALRHTQLFVASNVDVLNLVIDFVDEPRPVHKARKSEPAPTPAPRGSILAGRLARIAWDRPRDLPGDPRQRPVDIKIAIEGRDRPEAETDLLAEPMLPAAKASPASRAAIARLPRAEPAPVDAPPEEAKQDA